MKIFIGCSSKNEIDERYFEIGKEVGKRLSNLGFDLVLGGAGNSGIMKSVLEEFINNNRGITINTLDVYKEDFSLVKNSNINILEDTFMRTRNNYLTSDLLLFLPGGTGTISEIFSTLEEARTGIKKEIILFNYNNYFDRYIKDITVLVKDHFNDYDILNYLKLFNDIDDLTAYLEKKI